MIIEKFKKSEMTLKFKWAIHILKINRTPSIMPYFTPSIHS